MCASIGVIRLCDPSEHFDAEPAEFHGRIRTCLFVAQASNIARKILAQSSDAGRKSTAVVSKRPAAASEPAVSELDDAADLRREARVAAAPPWLHRQRV